MDIEIQKENNIDITTITFAEIDSTSTYARSRWNQIFSMIWIGVDWGTMPVKAVFGGALNLISFVFSSIINNNASSGSKPVFDLRSQHIQTFINEMRQGLDKTHERMKSLKENDSVADLLQDLAFRVDIFEFFDSEARSTFGEKDSMVQRLEGHLVLAEILKLELEETASKQMKSNDIDDLSKCEKIEIKKIFPPVPFNNPSENRCYLNSSLQALFASPYFREWVRRPFPSLEEMLRRLYDEYAIALTKASEVSEKNRIQKKHRNAIKEILTTYESKITIHELLTKLLHKLDEEDSCQEEIGRIRDALFKFQMSPEFTGYKYQQSDAGCVFEVLCEVYGQVLFNKDVRFGKWLEKRVESVSIDEGIPFLRIPLGEQGDTFQNLIDNAYQEIPSDDTYKFDLSNGNETDPISFTAKTCLQLVDGSPPDILMVQLMRFQGIKKDHTVVPFDHDVIDLSCAFDQLELGAQSAKYKLRSYVEHQGSSKNSGHYVAHVLNEDQWYCCNDETISSVEKATPGKGYMFVFERIQN